MGIEVQKTVTRWSCCFSPKQVGLPELFNQSSAICLLCYNLGAKILPPYTTSISANFCCFDTDALFNCTALESAAQMSITLRSASLGARLRTRQRWDYFLGNYVKLIQF